MRLLNTNISSKMRKQPKTMLYTGDSDLETKIVHYRYTKNSFVNLENIEEPSDDSCDMIVVEGFENKEGLIDLANKFGINDFYVEDIFNVSQRNKINTTDNQIFIVLKYATLQDNDLEFRRIYFILKKGLVLLFTDYENNYINILLERINNNTAVFTTYDESYIIYTIYDMLVDEQLEMSRILKQELEELEIDILQSTNQQSEELFTIHKQLVQLRNNARSLAEYVSPKEILKEKLFNQDLNPFIIDLEDHIFNLQEKLHNNIDVCNTLITMYSTKISNRTNDVMKTLTIISVIFIPLSFLAGVFGMNFTNFSLLQNEFGLIIFVSVSLFIAFGMLLWFRHKKWL